MTSYLVIFRAFLFNVSRKSNYKKILALYVLELYTNPAIF